MVTGLWVEVLDVDGVELDELAAVVPQAANDKVSPVTAKPVIILDFN